LHSADDPHRGQDGIRDLTNLYASRSLSPHQLHGKIDARAALCCSPAAALTLQNAEATPLWLVKNQSQAGASVGYGVLLSRKQMLRERPSPLPTQQERSRHWNKKRRRDKQT